MRRPALLLVVSLLAACAPAASSPTPSVAPATSSALATTSVPTVTPTRSPSASPSATPTPIVLPTSAYLAAAGNGVVWMYVADSRLFLSRDRGETWQERVAPPIINGNVAFVDDRNGWALTAGSPATGCKGQGWEILRTTDGAATWTSTYRSATADPGCKGNVAFVDTKTGYVSVSSRDAAPVVMRTSDGGATWSPSQRLPDPPGVSTAGVDAGVTIGPVADFGAQLLVYGGGQSTSGYATYVFRSVDRGATWSYVGMPPVRGAAVVFVTASRWLEIAPGDASRETTDGGATWHPFRTDYDQAAPLAPQIVFGDANTGYATVRGVLRRTTDGGAHWTVLKTPGT